MILLNQFFENGKAHLLFRTEKGKRILSCAYHPYFYAVCEPSEAPERICHLLGQHPLVISCRVEKGAVRITTLHADFKPVISDIGKIPGIRELAETSVPHSFRFMTDRKLGFFREYGETTSVSALKEIEAEDILPRLRLGLLAKDGGRFCISSTDGKIMGPEEADILFSAGAGGIDIRQCVHIDVKEDMAHDIYNESGAPDFITLAKERLIRVIELSSIANVKPDLIPRITPGKLNVYLHMAAAKNMGMLIPDIKKSTERPKSLRLLRVMDKGGTILYPRPGIYHDVAKCDFASMYPNIIVKYNISPEMMHCGCGGIKVPEAGWNICNERKGLIPLGIGTVLERRLELKRMMKAEADPERKRVLNLRQKALKNILVTCFGYLGFKNFIFSNVECKEAVMLFGRHILERTKMIAEEDGLEVLYGVVDSVFVCGAGGSAETERGIEPFRKFVARASAEFGFELELDCVFKSIAFPSSADGSGVANKYYGMTYDGKIEARGISLRHSDSPVFIKEFQEKAIRALFSEKNLEDGRRHLAAIINEYASLIKSRKIPLADLAITRSVMKASYKANQPHVAASRYDAGACLRGFVVFVFTVYGPRPVAMAKMEETDYRSYLHLLNQAAEELTLGIGGEKLK